MFWDRFYELCIKNNTKPNPVAKELGYSSAVCTKWGTGVLPKADALIKIGSYFNVSIDYLLENEIALEKERQAEEKQMQAEQKTEETNKRAKTEKTKSDKTEKAEKAEKIEKVKKVKKEEKAENTEEKTPVFDFEFASAPPPDQPEIIIEEKNGKKRIKNLKSTDTVWVQSAAYEGIFPSFDKKAGFIKYTVEELEELLNADDVIM